MSEDEFEEFFHNEKPEDPKEYGKREDALRKHEKEIHDVNEKYQNGESSWFDEVNELSDLPDDEFVRDHTGAITNIVAGRGLLEPPPEKMVDPASEAYFASIRMNRGSAPDSYSSLDLGDNILMLFIPNIFVCFIDFHYSILLLIINVIFFLNFFICIQD